MAMNGNININVVIKGNNNTTNLIDKKEGKGIYYFAKGDRYEGDFRNDKPEGKGINYYANGDRYEGDHRNGQAEGKGN